jgi:polyisoprenoid-binding protein YceI
MMVPDGDFSRATVDVVIDASSIDTGVVRRDDHLRSADYLDVDRYPNIIFSGRRVSAEPDGRLVVVGVLTLRDVTHDVSLTVVPNGGTLEPWGKQRVAFSASAAINRRDFGFIGNPALDAGGLVIGQRIEVEIEVEAVKQPALLAA